MFGANLVILAQMCDEFSRGQAEFLGILSQNGQNDLEGQGQWPIFLIPAESILWSCLVQICWFQFKSETSYPWPSMSFWPFWIRILGWWKRFPQHRPFVRGIQRSQGGFPHKGTVIWKYRGLIFSLMLAWTSCWTQTVKLPVVSDATTVIWHHCDV